ncbi:desumoylating isopeptidase 1 [Plakobranchus ocellatus]|uniref:Desumoylating isopeptidase 1 n=1 Tax=Plakobranchus ocellatus TaxID=259542 RepID=A0AAV4ACR0_9GAST|nr:desumoylating isopeptidase 1 [Plakobranchus ocellatus]
MTSTVTLYVYDLSQGLARVVSQGILGRQIDGIWHTAIVVFGNEYFFGSVGIEACGPGGTILGQPNQKIDLGTTEIPFDLFMQYLEELSETSFKGSTYHLLYHNCNNFSSELAQFLTGKDIPSHITNLPQELLNTSLGAMIQPIVEAMQVRGGHSPFQPGSH